VVLEDGEIVVAGGSDTMRALSRLGCFITDSVRGEREARAAFNLS
jgi:hypothetical protein